MEWVTIMFGVLYCIHHLLCVLPQISMSAVQQVPMTVINCVSTIQGVSLVAVRMDTYWMGMEELAMVKT